MVYDKVILNLSRNISGLDAVILILCFLIYRIIVHSRKGDDKDTLLGIKAMMYIGIALIIARVILTIFT